MDWIIYTTLVGYKYLLSVAHTVTALLVCICGVGGGVTIIVIISVQA